MDIEIAEIIGTTKSSLHGMFDLDVQYRSGGAGRSGLFDGVLSIGDVSFACVLVQKMSQYNVNMVTSQCIRAKAMQKLPVLLLTGEMSAGMMRQMHDAGIQVMDAAGNCYIQAGGLMMFCQGQKGNLFKDKEVLSFKEPGLKVLYHILMNPKNVNLPFREIQAQTGVGLATINKLFGSLKQNGYLFTSSSGRHLKKMEGLLSIFVDNYCRVMKPKALMTTMKFMPNGRERWQEIGLPQGMQWGGEPGAYIKDGFLIPEVWDVYSTVASQELIRSRIAVPAQDGEIRVYRKFWLEEEEKAAPALIIYADLMGSGDSRCIEAAQRILNNELSYLRQ